VQVAPNRRPGEVSGGQAQRIALCRAILSRPSVILADEPTGNLDKSTSTLVIDALRAEAERGAVVVVATHDEDVMRSCDRRLDL
jgi:ABC-type lipoprotein export system ATPase subunit